MSKTAGPRTAGEINKHWRELAERRRQHLLELHRSGRWKRYYSEDQLQAKLRDAVRDIEEWSRLSGEQPAAGDLEAARPAGAAE